MRPFDEGKGREALKENNKVLHGNQAVKKGFPHVKASNEINSTL